MITRNERAIVKRARIMQASLGVAAMAALLFGLKPTLAQGDNDPRAGEVAVGGKTVLTIRVPSAGLSIRQRAEAINARLVTILADPDLKPSDIVAVPLSRTAAKITVKNQLLVTVDAETAKINQAKPMALAQIWVDHLRRVLPRVNVKPNPNSGEPPHSN